MKNRALGIGLATISISFLCLNAGRAENQGSPPVVTEPDADPDGDGLTNQEEAEYGTKPNVGGQDTDGDGVLDGQDGWAKEPAIKKPRLPESHYAIVNLNALGLSAWPRGLDDQNRVLGDINPAILFNPSTGVTQQTSLHGSFLSLNGYIAGSYSNGASDQAAIWSQQGGLTLLPFPSYTTVPNSSRHSTAYCTNGTVSAGDMNFYGKDIHGNPSPNPSADDETWWGNGTLAWPDNSNIQLLHYHSVGASISTFGGGSNAHASIAAINNLGMIAATNNDPDDYTNSHIVDGGADHAVEGLIRSLSDGPEPLGVGNATFQTPEGPQTLGAIYYPNGPSWNRNPLKYWNSSPWDFTQLPNSPATAPRDEPLFAQRINQRGEMLGDQYGGVYRNGHPVDIFETLGEQWASVDSYGGIYLNNKGVIACSAITAAGDAVTALLVPADIIPDFNRDGVIDDHDRGKITKESPFRAWLNDDDDSGETEGEDIPEATSQDCQNIVVDGVRDLVDWFPLWLDIQQLLEVLPPSQFTYKLTSKDGAFNFVMTDLSPDHAGDYLRDIDMAEAIAAAEVTTVDVEGDGFLDPNFLNAIKNDGKGVVLIEASKVSTEPIELRIYKNSSGALTATYEFPVSFDGVEKMYRHKNLLAAGGGNPGSGRPNYDGEPDGTGPKNYPDKLCSSKSFVFVHGYNVNGQQARGWSAEMFKRLYWSGSKAKFYGVTWYGAESQQSVLGHKLTPDYHVNVTHAFSTGLALASFITNLGDHVIVAAHSLGNIVLSSAIQDGGASPAKTFMIDAVVALECFNGGSPTEPAMIHPDWTNYETRGWASEWYLNPEFAAGDERKKLTWRDRFNNVGGDVYNFYSSSEEVLRKHETNPISLDSTQMLSGTYVWALQEKTKGRRIPLGSLFIGSTYGGWAFTNSYDDSLPPAPPYPHTPSANEATGISNQTLTTMPVFDPGYSLNYSTKVPHASAPSWIADLTDDLIGSSTAQAHRSQLLAEMFPARTLPAGANSVQSFGLAANFNMPALYKNGWPLNRGNNTDWKHSDLKEVAYTYIYKLFDKFKTTGDLAK